MKKILMIAALLLTLPVTAMACGGGDSRVKMTAEILSVGEELSVTVTESEYTSGIHTVLLSGNTEYFDTDGERINADGLKAGDTVVIYYNGQVMMSYPPKIVAVKIIKC